MNWVVTAMLSGLAARVRKAACSTGRVVGAVLRVVVHDTGRHHHAQPFAQVAFGYTGSLRQPPRGEAGVGRQRIEKPGAVAKRTHDGKRGLVQSADKAVCEGFGLGVIKGEGLGLVGHRFLLRVWKWAARFAAISVMMMDQPLCLH
jgi:hypothetical protein